MAQNLHYIRAQWPAPTTVAAFSSTLSGGQSKGVFASNNLALHVGDDATDVYANRRALSHQFSFTHDPAWLNQTHSTRCVVVEDTPSREADAAITRTQGQPLVILTADCLPILLCDRNGQEIAAIHAGWKGLVHGIIEQTIGQMRASPTDILAWIGPGICNQCYAVGNEVVEQFATRYPFTTHTLSNQRANLASIAELILNACGVLHVTPSNLCTFEQSDQFYSYRRNAQTGRIASFIWIKPTKEANHA